MKKNILFLILILLIAFVAACNSSTEEPASAADADGAPPEFELAPEMALMMGTVRLDETEYAIDAAQAAELLPLWKALRSLSESETAATAEAEALVNQIQETMTAEQMDAIAAMNLSMQDLAAIQETLGIEGGSGGFGGGGEVDPELQATRQAARESGEAPPGGGLGPGGGQGRGGSVEGAEMDPAARETAMAERGGTRGANIALNTNFLNAIIEFLAAKV